jgi:cytochrome c-type biogenesis protein CcmH/NrfG
MPSLQRDKNPATSTSKLNRLEGFLVEDPGNESLRVDLFELALATDHHERAEWHVMAALTLCNDQTGWRFRLASLRIAQGRLQEASEILDDLQAKEGAHPIIAYNRAVVAFMRKEYQSCSEILSPWVSASPIEGISAAASEQLLPENQAYLQILWLRSLHRLGQLEQAWAWIVNQRTRNTLTAAAAGVACLIAVDFDHAEQVEELARLADGHPASRQEVHLSLGTLLLSRNDTMSARHQLEQALALNSSSGRVWSTLGFVDLQDQHADQAVTDFERSVQLMPEHVGTWIGLGWAHLIGHKDLLRSHKAFQTALDLDHNFAESHGCLAVILAAKGRQQEARHHIELADRLSRGNMAARYAEAVLSGEAADAAAMRRLARRLLLNRAPQ